MNFGKAQAAIERGVRVRRSGWNGKGMWISKVTSTWSGQLCCRDPLPANWKGYLPFYVMFTADGYLVPWLISQTDALATDWEVVPSEVQP